MNCEVNPEGEQQSIEESDSEYYAHSRHSLRQRLPIIFNRKFNCEELFIMCSTNLAIQRDARILSLMCSYSLAKKCFKPAAHERTCRAYLLFVTSWIDKISSCAGNIYGIFVIRDM